MVSKHFDALRWKMKHNRTLLLAALAMAGSKAELARVAGVARPLVYYWLKGGNPSPQAIIRIANTYGIPKEDLMPSVFAPRSGD